MADKQPFPSQQQDRFIVRLPDGMRDRIAQAATTNNRSMNAEIVARLEAATEQIEKLLIASGVSHEEIENARKRTAALRRQLEQEHNALLAREKKKAV